MTRITQSMLNQNMLHNLQRNYGEMQKYQEQATTGKRISRPSDDPVAAVRSMFHRSSLNEIEQFKRNAEDGILWMEATDGALKEGTEVLHRVRELTVKGLSDSNNPSDRQAIAAEINQLKEHLGDVANSQISGKYIFLGVNAETPPYQDGNVNFENEEVIEVQVRHSKTEQINSLGSKVFSNGEIFNLLENIVTDFEEGTGTDELLKDFDAYFDNILKEHSTLGARMNRMELSMSRIDELELTTTEMLSKEEDVDIAKAIIDFKTQENIQQAALSIGARIIQPSLIDFLR